MYFYYEIHTVNVHSLRKKRIFSYAACKYMHVLGVMKNLQLLRKIRTLVRIFFEDLKSVKQKFDDFIEISIFKYKSTQMQYE